MELLNAVMKPKEIAIAKCATHKSDTSRVNRGNNAADEAAKAAAGTHKTEKVLLVTHVVDLEDNITLRDIMLMQEGANTMDKQLWLARGASKDATGLWRNHDGLVVAPPDLLGLLINAWTCPCGEGGSEKENYKRVWFLGTFFARTD